MEKKAIILVVALLWLPVCLVQAQETPPLKIVVAGVQPLAIPNGIVSVVISRDALLKERLAKLGVEIRFLPFAKGKDINTAVHARKVDVAFVGDTPAIEMAATGDIVVAAMLKMAFASIVSREVMTVADLKGRAIANATHSTAHHVLLTALHHAGLDEKDVTLEAMDVGQMVRALEEGKVDAFAAWEPIPSVALEAHPQYFVVHRGLTFSFLYFTKKLVEEQPQAYRELLAALVRAIYWMKEKPEHLDAACRWNLEDATAFSEEPPAVFLSQCVTITRRDLLSPVPQGRIPVVLLQDKGPIAEQFRFLQHVGKINPELAVSRVMDSFDTQSLEQILADPTLYQWRNFRPLSPLP